MFDQMVEQAKISQLKALIKKMASLIAGENKVIPEENCGENCDGMKPGGEETAVADAMPDVGAKVIEETTIAPVAEGGAEKMELGEGGDDQDEDDLVEFFRGKPAEPMAGVMRVQKQLPKRTVASGGQFGKNRFRG